MALRVLLADESTTIKKVMQLALQDFAVEVKAVHAGVDVLDVARSFKPDLIFVDVLLQKKNGYEVCGLLKADPELKSIPVILMWSSFMDLDDALAKASGAEARLEKPFDVETLRKQVLELVPKTRSQRLAHFLEYPQKFNEDLKGDAKAAAPASEPPAAKVAAPRPTAPPVPAPAPIPGPNETPSTWSMASFDDPANFETTTAGADVSDAPADADEEEFKPLELSQLGQNPTTQTPLETFEPEPSNEFAPVPGDDEVWARQDLSQFKLDLPPITVGDGSDGGENFNIDLGDQEFSRPDFNLNDPAQNHSSVQMPPRRKSDLALDIDEINAAPEIALPLEPMLETVDSAGFDSPNFGSDLEPMDLAADPSFESPFESSFETTREPVVPQLSADRLEAIIRAQSREIIEQVVRKMVPELASTIIREELERLLEDTAVKDPRI